jgi:cell division protein FtsW (lipid II flippase)
MLFLIIVAAYAMLIRMVAKIKNRLGKVLSFSCILTLVLQFVIYTMGNFGFQFGWFCNFPFISEGNISIITNAILVGLACSVYRYDKVVREEKIEVIQDNSSIKIL